MQGKAHVAACSSQGFGSQSRKSTFSRTQGLREANPHHSLQHGRQLGFGAEGNFAELSKKSLSVWTGQRHGQKASRGKRNLHQGCSKPFGNKCVFSAVLKSVIADKYMVTEETSKKEEKKKREKRKKIFFP